MADQPMAPGDIVQMAGTISAISLTLAALLKEEGWAWQEVHIVPVAFIFAGLISLLGALVAMTELWRRAGLNHWSVLILRIPISRQEEEDTGYFREALLLSG